MEQLFKRHKSYKPDDSTFDSALSTTGQPTLSTTAAPDLQLLLAKQSLASGSIMPKLLRQNLLSQYMEQVSEHDRSYGSSAASRTSSGNSSVAFGSTYTPRRGGGGDSSGRQRSSAEELRSSSHHAEVVASVEEDPAPEPEHEPLLGDRRARQNSPVELSLRCVTDQRLALPFR